MICIFCFRAPVPCCPKILHY